ncbi:endonuclease MutS2 [Calditrichota bacterium]
MNSHHDISLNAITALEFDRLRSQLVELAGDEASREKLKLLSPSKELGWIKDELQRVEEARGLSDRGVSLLPMGSRDIRHLMKKAAVQGSALSGEELIDVLKRLQGFTATRKVLDKEHKQAPQLSRAARDLTPIPDLQSTIERSIAPDGTVLDSASPKLAKLRRQISVQQGKIRQKMTTIMARLTRKGVLREDNFTIRDGRYVLPVRSDAMGSINGIVHDRSATGNTLFVEPTTLVTAGNELRAFELEERDEVRRILREITSEIKTHAEAINTNLQVITKLDIYASKAQLAQMLDATAPTAIKSGTLRIYGGRHPLLALDEEREVVPLTLELGANNQMLVISGPNAGGKSVALKCVGLFCLMAACGLHLPALPGTEIPIYDGVLTDIGDEQSIQDDLSTFSSHAVRLKRILEDADIDTLVLIDEIGAGTDPKEGASLSIAVLERLLKLNAPTIVTTHHGALKAFASETEGCANGSMEFDLKTLTPTYKFHPDIPGSSYALEIARRAGMSQAIIDRAREVLGTEEMRLETLVMELSQKVRDYENLQTRGERQVAEQAALEDAYNKKLQQLAARERNLKKKAKVDAEEILRTARKQVEAVVREIRESNASTESIKKAQTVLKSGAKKLVNELEVQAVIDDVPQPPKREPKPELILDREIEVGDWVVIDGGTTRGEITALSSRKDRVCVVVGAVQLWVTRERVTLTEPPEQEGSTQVYMTLPQVPFELDIRGLDAQEALLRVDRYLHDGFSAGREKLGIIHGKGNGILSQHVRKHLKSHKVVESFRFGEYGEGDYGVTIVTVKKS